METKKIFSLLVALTMVLSPVVYAASDTEAEIKFSASNTVLVGEGDAADTQIRFDGNAQDYHIGLDDSADDLVIGLGSTVGTTPAISVDENQVVTFAQDPVFGGTTPNLTVGDGGAEDAQVSYDGNAQDFAHGIDDTTDELVIAKGTALGTTNIVSIASTPTAITLHDATEADAQIDIDGNAVDFSFGLDDSADAFSLSLSNVLGTTEVFNADGTDVTFTDNIVSNGTFDGSAGTTRVEVGTVASLTACAGGTQGNVAVVTDGNSGTDCTTGTGSDVNLCFCDGTNYITSTA